MLELEPGNRQAAERLPALQAALEPAIDTVSRTLHESLRQRMQAAIDEAVSLEIARVRVRKPDARS